jgi:hypothetical protein
MVCGYLVFVMLSLLLLCSLSWVVLINDFYLLLPCVIEEYPRPSIECRLISSFITVTSGIWLIVFGARIYALDRVLAQRILGKYEDINMIRPVLDEDYCETVVQVHI